MRSATVTNLFPLYIYIIIYISPLRLALLSIILCNLAIQLKKNCDYLRAYFVLDCTFCGKLLLGDNADPTDP